MAEIAAEKIQKHGFEIYDKATCLGVALPRKNMVRGKEIQGVTKLCIGLFINGSHCISRIEDQGDLIKVFLVGRHF